LNGKLSLIALEAHLNLAQAATARQADFLLSHTTFQQRWERLGFEMAFGLRERRNDWRAPLTAATEHALAQAQSACALLKNHHVVITGPVNAGKSTLTNLLARSERHIVSPTPGTTLDRLDVAVSVRGLSVLLSDTAGLRKADDELEREGQRRAQSAAADAALRLVVLDGSLEPGPAELALLENSAALGPLLVVLNKSDLGIHPAMRELKSKTGRESCIISARDGRGLDELEGAIETLLLGSSTLQSAVPFTSRQIHHLTQLHRNLAENADGSELVIFFRKLIGTRPDADELLRALGFSA
jgi:small GTP-binding protein